MKKTIRQRISAASYKKIAKPIMFRLSPDNVHARMVKAAGGLARKPRILSSGKKWLSYHSTGSLAQDIVGLHFASPIGIAAGLDKNGEMMHVADMIGCGFTTVGSVTYEPRIGNSRPWFHRLPKTRSIVVHAGMPNKGLLDIAQRLKRRPTTIPTFLSVAVVAQQADATDEEVIDDVIKAIDYITVHDLCEVIEVNISCPNIRDKEFFTNPDKLDALLSRIDELRLTRPVFLKMPNLENWARFEAMLEAIVRHQVDGVTIANLVKERESVILKDDLPDQVRGGLSGIPTRDRSTELVRRTRQMCGDKLAIIGLGGVFTAEDAYEKLKAGADLVGMATGLIFEGPQVVNEINAGIEKKLRDDGCKSIGDLRVASPKSLDKE